MKTATKTTLLLAIFFMLGATTEVKSQGCNFMSLLGKALQMGTGDLVFKGKNHNGVQWSFTVNVSYDSKPILPAKQCLHGFSEVSNAITLASLNKEANTAAAKNFMSKNQVMYAYSKISFPAAQQPIAAPFNWSAPVNNDSNTNLKMLASL